MVFAGVSDFQDWRSRITGNPGRENLLPNVVGLKGPLGCLNQGALWDRLGSAWSGDGLLRYGAAQYAKTRKQFANKPIASHQLVQEKLAWMITEIVKGQLLALHVGTA